MSQTLFAQAPATEENLQHETTADSTETAAGIKEIEAGMISDAAADRETKPPASGEISPGKSPHKSSFGRKSSVYTAPAGPLRALAHGSSLPAPTPTKPQKSQYSEAEVAIELGITIQALRGLLRNHVVDQDEDLNNVPSTSFHPSDLLVLRMLAGMAPKPLES